MEGNLLEYQENMFSTGTIHLLAPKTPSYIKKLTNKASLLLMQLILYLQNSVSEFC